MLVSFATSAAKVRFFFEICKFICKNQEFVAENLRNSDFFCNFASDFDNQLYIVHRLIVHLSALVKARA